MALPLAHADQSRSHCIAGTTPFCVTLSLSDVSFGCEFRPDGYTCVQSGTWTLRASGPAPGRAGFGTIDEIYACGGAGPAWCDQPTWQESASCSWTLEGGCSTTLHFVHVLESANVAACHEWGGSVDGFASVAAGPDVGVGVGADPFPLRVFEVQPDATDC